MRLLSGATATAAAPQQPAAVSARETAGAGKPAEGDLGDLTRDKLREIMTFNAVTLEKELKPIRKQIEQIRARQPDAQVGGLRVVGVSGCWVTRAVFGRKLLHRGTARGPHSSHPIPSIPSHPIPS